MSVDTIARNDTADPQGGYLALRNISTSSSFINYTMLGGFGGGDEADDGTEDELYRDRQITEKETQLENPNND